MASEHDSGSANVSGNVGQIDRFGYWVGNKAKAKRAKELEITLSQ
jgi:hypothetical protein